MDVSVMQICGPPGIRAGWFRHLPKSCRIDKTETQGGKKKPDQYAFIWVVCRRPNKEIKAGKNPQKKHKSGKSVYTVFQFLCWFYNKPIVQCHPLSIFTFFSTIFLSFTFRPVLLFSLFFSASLFFCTHLAGKVDLRHPDVCWTGSLRWQQLPAHHRRKKTGGKNISLQFNFKVLFLSFFSSLLPTSFPSLCFL